MNTVSASKFSWRGNLGVCEASDLAGDMSSAMDVCSPRTGATRRFELTLVERDSDNDVVSWWYGAPGTPLVLRVFND